MKSFIKLPYILDYRKKMQIFGESESISNQKALLLGYVQSIGYELVDIYIDDGCTGTNFNRPAFQKMIKDIEDKKINMVVTKDLSRLSRDYIGTGEYIEKWFPAHNVRYIALTDNIDTAVDSSNNDIAPFKAILNDMYAKDLSKKIRTALHTMQKQGKWVGGCTPIGYRQDPEDKNHLIIDEEEGKIAKYIFQLALDGNNHFKIRDILEKENIPTVATLRNRYTRGNTQVSGHWYPSTIKKILKNELYTGDMIQNRRSRISYKYRKVIDNRENEWIVVPNTHEAIIEKSKFELIQQMVIKNSHRNEKTRFYLLDGLLRCYECKHKIGIKAHHKRLNSYMHCNYYRANSKLNVCTSHGFCYNHLEEEILQLMEQVIQNTSNQKIANSLKNRKFRENELTEEQQIKIFQNEISTIKSKLEKMYVDLLDEKITEELYRNVSNKLTGELQEKTNELNEMMDNNHSDDRQKKKDIKEIVKEFLETNSCDRKTLLRLVNRIEIHQDKQVDIHFNFKELTDFAPILEGCKFKYRFGTPSMD